VQKTSTYYKIRDVLDTASTRSADINELAEALHGNSSSFVYSRRDEDGIVRELPVARDKIRRTIRFCVDLGLLQSEERSILTDAGRNALDADHFDLQLQLSVRDYLSKHQLSWERIEEAIKNLQLPHASALYQELKPKDLNWDRFRICFFLLSECAADSEENLIIPFQRKLYLLRERTLSSE